MAACSRAAASRAACSRRRRACAAFGLGPRGGRAQVGQQGLQGLGVATQFLGPVAAVLVAFVQLGDQLGLGAAVALQLNHLGLLALVGVLQRGAARLDLALQRLQLLQLAGERGDLAGHVALHVAVVDHGAVGVGHAVLRQQHLQRRVAAGHVGRAQQLLQLGALAGQALLHLRALVLQLRQGGFFLAQRGLGLGELAAGLADLFIGRA